MIDPSLKIILSVLVTNGISILVGLILLGSYLIGNNKAFSLKMICIINAYDTFFHIANILIYLQLSDSFSFYLNIVREFALQSSLLWTCNIAYFIYKLLSLRGLKSPQKYFVRSTLILFLLAVSICIM